MKIPWGAGGLLPWDVSCTPLSLSAPVSPSVDSRTSATMMPSGACKGVPQGASAAGSVRSFGCEALENFADEPVRVSCHSRNHEHGHCHHLRSHPPLRVPLGSGPWPGVHGRSLQATAKEVRPCRAIGNAIPSSLLSQPLDSRGRYAVSAVNETPEHM